MDFKVTFPFYSFDKEKININLVRRFLYKNKIPYYFLYDEKMVERQKKEKSKITKNKLKLIMEDDDLIENRFEILDFNKIGV